MAMFKTALVLKFLLSAVFAAASFQTLLVSWGHVEQLQLWQHGFYVFYPALFLWGLRIANFKPKRETKLFLIAAVVDLGHACFYLAVIGDWLLIVNAGLSLLIVLGTLRCLKTLTGTTEVQA